MNSSAEVCWLALARASACRSVRAVEVVTASVGSCKRRPAYFRTTAHANERDDLKRANGLNGLNELSRNFASFWDYVGIIKETLIVLFRARARIPLGQVFRRMVCEVVKPFRCVRA